MFIKAFSSPSELMSEYRQVPDEKSTKINNWQGVSEMLRYINGYHIGMHICIGNTSSGGGFYFWVGGGQNDHRREGALSILTEK